MNNNLFSFEPSQIGFEKVIRFGKYYYPACLRYPGGSIIICDRCDQRDLRACLGYYNLDLCLICANIVIDTMQHGKHASWERVPLPDSQRENIS